MYNTYCSNTQPSANILIHQSVDFQQILLNEILVASTTKYSLCGAPYVENVKTAQKKYMHYAVFIQTQTSSRIEAPPF